ncbi:hypothetical protein [Pleionea sediminis]|uniref:hypothetical protein n=1 Tax=Pleionea sediminis TaxID=2569479 RepID=UPI001184DCA5|nr:hypothetical protein [Pleionea sediminis]
MLSELFSDLTLNHVDFKLPNGKMLRLSPLTVNQRIDTLEKIKVLREQPDNHQGLMDFYREVVALSALDEDFKPRLTDADLAFLQRYDDGRLLSQMFADIVQLSGSTDVHLEAAKKKSESPTSNS